jgi:3-methylcrotonyl-CoA carboxylase alpha subunit
VEGVDVPVQYDPMLAKLITHGVSREAAIGRMSAALRAFPILGVRTNVAFLLNVIRHPAFASGDLHTGFVDEHLADLLETPEPSELVRAAAAFTRDQPAPAASSDTPTTTRRTTSDPWGDLTGWGR